MSPGEIRFWRKVSADLGIDIVTPFETTLPNGTRIKASALVKDFGANLGMVVDADSSVIEPHRKILAAHGYGFSSNFGHSPESYDRDQMIEILVDWGWTGEPSARPAWLP